MRAKITTVRTHPVDVWRHEFTLIYAHTHMHAHTPINNKMKFPNYNEVCDS